MMINALITQAMKHSHAIGKQISISHNEISVEKRT